MKYAILDESGNQIQWCNDDTVKKLPKNAILLNDEEWEKRFDNVKISTADKINNLKRDRIVRRKEYLAKTQHDALEAVIEGIEYEFTAKRNLAKQEIKDIEAAKTITALNSFDLKFD